MTGNRIGIQGFVMFGVCLFLAGGTALGDGEYFTNVAPGAGVAQTGSGNGAA